MYQFFYSKIVDLFSSPTPSLYRCYLSRSLLETAACFQTPPKLKWPLQLLVRFLLLHHGLLFCKLIVAVDPIQNLEREETVEMVESPKLQAASQPQMKRKKKREEKRRNSSRVKPMRWCDCYVSILNWARYPHICKGKVKK